ncbi:hypothetical protein DOTSEDRAFT_129089 [Dothistroma septosporum NZE10]|uniref:N-acetyltransferase domain-containing protein n=1 Tax=Dothistroma septosporum (strain NZE10 / CBS 128990) TaxID=675120 RepID=N1PQS7_DOTSN|nr:hypothetical protein DOTSEDRAFT_129089 [Dothistroma septosporum NZE10]
MKPHTFFSSLSYEHAAMCHALEKVTFPPAETATLAKFQYRLSRCPELCLGMFVDVAGAAKVGGLADDLRLHDDTGHDGVLIGQISATRTSDDTVTEGAMASPPSGDCSTTGHRAEGRTVCIHAVAIVPAFQKLGLGRRMVSTYLQFLAQGHLADRVAILAHDHLLQYYESFGFVNCGLSKNLYGDGGWYDMICELGDMPVASRR